MWALDVIIAVGFYDIMLKWHHGEQFYIVVHCNSHKKRCYGCIYCTRLCEVQFWSSCSIFIIFSGLKNIGAIFSMLSCLRNNDCCHFCHTSNYSVKKELHYLRHSLLRTLKNYEYSRRVPSMMAHCFAFMCCLHISNTKEIRIMRFRWTEKGNSPKRDLINKSKEVVVRASALSDWWLTENVCRYVGCGATSSKFLARKCKISINSLRE